VLSKGQVTPVISPRRTGAILALLVGCQFIIVLDVSVVNLALPSIQRSFHVPTGGLQGIITAYTVAFGGPLILGGRIADRLGRKRIFRVGLVGFGLMSLICSLSGSTLELVISRACQGLFAALLAPSALGLLTEIFSEGPARVHALSRFGAATMLGSMSGLIIGGTVVTLLGWRGIFFINVPIAIVMAAAAGPLIRGDEVGRPGWSLRSFLTEMDVGGAVLVTAGLSFFVLGLDIGSTRSWSDPWCLTYLSGAVALLVLFIWVEIRAKDPILNLDLFRIDTVRVGNILVLIFGLVGGASSLILAIYFQEVRHYSALVAGLALVPQGVTGYVVSRCTSRIFGWMGYRRAMVWSFSIGAVLVAAEGAFLSPGRSYLVFLPIFILLGGSQVISSIGATLGTSSGVRREELGIAGALRQTSFEIGFSVGVGLATSIAATWTHFLITNGSSSESALSGGYKVAVMSMAVFYVAGALMAGIGLRHHVGR
jgi:MFS family permease